MENESAASGASRQDHASCCIVGGGPAGVMLGFLLARSGVDVLVLEKHKDFFRDFRGDTIHPSTLELLNELHILEDFLQRPHQEVREISAHFGERLVHIARFERVPTRCKFVALMPQWDFLNFLSSHAAKYPCFRLQMSTEVTELLFEDRRVAGVRARTPQGILDIRADLVIGADGRNSTVRKAAGLEVIDSGSPIDVLWFRLSKCPGDPPQAFGFVSAGQFMVMIDRADYWQCAYVIPKDSFDEKRGHGLPAFRDEIKRCVPFLDGRVDEIKQWDDVKLLSVRVDHLKHWYRDGLLCIGDAAHAMSPVGGVGINLAIQDAVAAANILAPRFRIDLVTEDDLKAVQNRRERAARLTQRVQIFLHEHLLKPIFAATKPIPPPYLLELIEKHPWLQKIPARMIGIGFRPEQIEIQEMARATGGAPKRKAPLVAGHN